VFAGVVGAEFGADGGDYVSWSLGLLESGRAW
jgi:hypothetical protein